MNRWYIKYDWRLKNRASENRKNMTEAEQIIWDKILRNKKLMWYKFIRQKMLSFFIVDFYCSKLQLVVEIDWSSHDEKIIYDLERENKIKEFWLNIIRFSNYDILNNIEKVKEILINYINNYEYSWRKVPPEKGVRGF